ncbi:sensor histidine kinase [Mesorhizobium marinum]|uniref:sensor histidine kinase n=1 Tax=Mesorhizobium marinum TaxID=3228790 RepID=UPI003467C80B
MSRLEPSFSAGFSAQWSLSIRFGRGNFRRDALGAVRAALITFGKGWLRNCLLAAISATAWLGSAAAQSMDADLHALPKRLLLLQSYGQNFQPFANWTTEVRSALVRQSPWPLSIQEHYVETAISGGAAPEARFVDYLSALYQDAPPDLVVTFGAPASRFVQKYRSLLFADVPTLLAAVNVRRVDPSMLSAKDAVVGTLVENVPLFENILRLLPQTETIAVIIGNSPPEQYWVKEVQRQLRPLLGDKVALRFYNERRFGEMLEDLEHLPPRSAIYFQQMMVDGAGVVYGDKDPLKSIVAVANAPIFTFDQSLFHGGVVGGPMTSPVDGARSIAEVVVRMLGGENPGDIHVPAIAFAQPKYDWRELRRWGISESRLPPGSEVVFRQPTPWQAYPWQMALIGAAVLLQGGLIAGLLRERRRRHSAETTARQRMTELAHTNRFSTAGEFSASIAHEMNQPLGAILSNAEAAQIILKSPAPDLPALKEIVDEILHNDLRASEVIRRIRSLLKKAPFEASDFDLKDLANETLEFLSALARGRKVDLSGEIASDPLPVRGDQVQMQQVFLNLVMNAIEAMKDLPSERRSLIVRTSREGGYAEFSVSDSGPGISDDKLKQVFEPFFTTKDDGMGMGLSIARTIVTAHDGQIVAKNREGGGATFCVSLPLRA